MCADLEGRCAAWARAGECDKNRGYMVDGVGACRASCSACVTCREGDWACIRSNRAQGGYLEVQREEMQWLGVPWWMD